MRIVITEDCEATNAVWRPLQPACGMELGYSSMASCRTESNDDTVYEFSSTTKRGTSPQLSSNLKIAVDADGYILITSTLALSKSLWGTLLKPLSSSWTILGCKDICAYVPAALRFDNVPGLITITLSTTCGRRMISEIPANNGPRRPPQAHLYRWSQHARNHQYIRSCIQPLSQFQISQV